MSPPFLAWVLTPEDIHYGRGPQRVKVRQDVLDMAYNRHPELFVCKMPRASLVPEAVWINPPAFKIDDKEESQIDKVS